jgi:HAD superfamily hydrolase (TIGR01549 family)
VSQSDRQSDVDTGHGDDATRQRRVVLFDMDGVLVEGRGTDAVVHDRALDDALAAWDLDPDAETRALLSGYEYDTDFARGCARLGVDPVAFYGLREQHGARRATDRLDAGSRTPYADVQVLAELAERYALGLVSNNYDAVVQFVVDHHGLDAFDHWRGRDPGVRGFYRRKPDPHHLLEAMEALDGTAGIYVGDRETDVLAATRAGLDAAFVRRPYNEADDLAVTPAIETDSLTDLAEQLRDYRWPSRTSHVDGQ